MMGAVHAGTLSSERSPGLPSEFLGLPVCPQGEQPFAPGMGGWEHEKRKSLQGLLFLLVLKATSLLPAFPTFLKPLSRGGAEGTGSRGSKELNDSGKSSTCSSALYRQRGIGH